MKWGMHLKRQLYCLDYNSVIVAVLIHFLCGIISALVGGNSFVYRQLLLPYFAPSSKIFILIWSFVYALLGLACGFYISSYSCYRSKWRLGTCLLYGSFLFTLFLWYPVFFGARLFTLALVVSACIISVSLFVFRHFMKRCRLAAFLLIPCIIWLFFCFFLNFCVIILN